VATFHLLTAGYAGDSVASTVSLVSAGSSLIVVDPGMVRSTDAIIGPLEGLGHHAVDVTDVVISHHHPDHTLNIALFPSARVHDHWAVYRNDVWTSRPAEGFEVADGVVLWETPGHTPQDITTVVTDGEQVYALTHLWTNKGAGFSDEFDTDRAALDAGRKRVLEVATTVVPGHGAPFPVEPTGTGTA
jgi:glyoxylase-like metal-dependent hydrolase (beta-lactamase superfamily II)